MSSQILVQGLIRDNCTKICSSLLQFQKAIVTYAQEYQNFGRKISEANAIIPSQVWPILKDDTSWKTYPPKYSQSIISTKNKFFEKINLHNKPKGKVFQSNKDKDVML